MKVGWCSLWFLTCTACGGGPKTAFTLHVDGPNCLGVVGFEVKVSSGSQLSPSGALLERSPILDPPSCALGAPFNVDSLDPQTPVMVNITGNDGAGRKRVGGTTTVNLVDGSADVALEPETGAAPEVLVVDRSLLLGAIALSNVDSMVLDTMTMGKPGHVLSVNRGDAGRYFDVDPAAYGVASNLAGTELVATFTVTQGPVPAKVRLLVSAMGPYFIATPR